MEREREKKRLRNGKKEAEDRPILCDPCQEFTVKFAYEKAPCGYGGNLYVSCQTQTEDKHLFKIT